MLARPKMPNFTLKKVLNQKAERILSADHNDKKSKTVNKNILISSTQNSFILRKHEKKIMKTTNKDEVKKLLKQKKLHENRIRLLKQETNNVIDETSTIEHLNDNKINSCVVKNKVLSIHLNEERKIDDQNKLNDALNELSMKRLSINRRKSSVFNDIYELSHIFNDSSADFQKSKGFTKSHIFDVYLDKEYRLPKNERMPSIISLYNKAHQLRLIQKFNPTNSNSFNELMQKSNESIFKKPNPKYDLKSKTLIFDGVKAKKEKFIYD